MGPVGVWSLLQSLVDFLLPPACPLCRVEGADELCAGCLPQVPRLHGEDAWDDVGMGLPVWAAAPFASPLRELILRVKYGSDTHPLTALGALVVARMPRRARLGMPDCVVPIPLSRARMRQRGFNQSEAIAEAVARRLHLPVTPRLLTRPGHREAQASLSRRERQRNLTRAFAAKACAGRSVLLVDDVVTTGSTLAAAGDVLRQAGARRVFGVCICRVPSRS
jgi:ComF family protein